MTNQAKEALEVIRKLSNIDERSPRLAEAIETLEQSLTPQAVDVEALRREGPEKCENVRAVRDFLYDTGFAAGWNEAIDHLAQRNLIVRDGWVAVPREPTDAMIQRGLVGSLDAPTVPEIPIWAYKAMISAVEETE